MSVNDFKIEVYNTAGSGVISQLYVKTDGNVEAEFANPAALKDLITKEYADTSYATEGHNHDGTYAPDVHDHDNRYFQETEFIDESAGTADAGKPIVLDGNGLISDTMLDIATFIYQGNWTPTSGTEYPNTSGLDIGAFWTIDGLTGDYTFTGGDLAGETITNEDLLIWGTEGWAMTKRDEDMSVYYKLDGSRAITDSFAGGGQQIKNIADATEDSDALTKGQADLAYEPIGGGGGDGDFMSDGSVPMTGGITFEAGNDNWISFYDTTESEQRVLIDADATGDAMTIALLPVSGSGDPGCQLRLDPGGNLSSSTQAPAISQDFINKGYADTEYVKIDGTSVMDHSLKIKSAGDIDTYVLFGRDSDGSFKGGVGSLDPSESIGLMLFESDGVTIANFVYLTPDGNVRLSNFVEPTDDKHLVTKKWVEDNAGGGGNRVSFHYDAQGQNLKYAVGISSIVYGSQGEYDANFTTPFASASYYTFAQAGGDDEADKDRYASVRSLTTTMCKFRCRNIGNDASDSHLYMGQCYL